MDEFCINLAIRGATIDELLSDDFETLSGQKADADLAARRLAAWCKSCCSGDWSLFNRRLNNDGLSVDQVLARFATVRRRPSAPMPEWIGDAIWIEAAMKCPPSPKVEAVAPDDIRTVFVFEDLFGSVIEQAEQRLWVGINHRAFENLSDSARTSLRKVLMEQLCNLSAASLYERFATIRNDRDMPHHSKKRKRSDATLLYDQFISEMRAGGLRRLFEEKPVLLRLIAVLTRQWIDCSRELVMRLDNDLAIVRQKLLHSSGLGPVTKIEGDLSDPHNGGHSVLIISFEDGARVMYKPKDVGLDAAWYDLVDLLNQADPPIDLKPMKTISREGYGWTEFVEHAGCADQNAYRGFFRRGGAWLALFYCFAAGDMHEENVIAVGEHPVPIDLEMILQATSAEQNSRHLDVQAFEAAEQAVEDTVLMVGLLPNYNRSADNKIFEMGGMAPARRSQVRRDWTDINSDLMRPWKLRIVPKVFPNLPHVGGDYAKLGDYIEDLVSGFKDYANFILLQRGDGRQGELFDRFSNLSVRKVLRPTQFYSMLLQRLKDRRNMDDGVLWSAHADFIGRLADWDKDFDQVWPLHQAERFALLNLNVPHFIAFSDGQEISDENGISIHTEATTGFSRALARFSCLDERDIAWQIDIIRETTRAVSRSVRPDVAVKPGRFLQADAALVQTRALFLAQANKEANDLATYAIRRGSSASWIGLDWLGDTEISQLVALGPDLYSGVSGISVFLAAHAAVTGCERSAALSIAGLAGLRRDLRSRNAARSARSLGIGGAMGLGSIVYALTLVSKSLQKEELLTDAQLAAELFTDDIIASDKQLDVMGGSAGGILGLLRLYRDTGSSDVLKRATKCGEHLLRGRNGPLGRLKLREETGGPEVRNGMSHGAAGLAYALAALSSATGRQEFADAASDYIEFENASYDAERQNWPEAAEPTWPCSWCHGASGIGLARIATLKQGRLNSNILIADIQNAVLGVKRNWPNAVDSLCCGTYGDVEFLREAAIALEESDLQNLASRWLTSVLKTPAPMHNSLIAGSGRFNVGLFRGIAGVGYTSLREVDRSLPNILMWE